MISKSIIRYMLFVVLFQCSGVLWSSADDATEAAGSAGMLLVAVVAGNDGENTVDEEATAYLSPAILTTGINTPFDLSVLVNSSTRELGAFEFMLTFDPDLLSIDTTRGDNHGVSIGADGLSNIAVNPDNLTGQLRVIGFDISSVGPGNNLEMIVVHFLTKANAANTPVSLEGSQLYDSLGWPITLLNLGAVIDITDILCGDVNDSGTISIVDALLIARDSAWLPPPAVYIAAAADVNNSGTISVVDALLVARHSAGLPTNGTCFPIDPPIPGNGGIISMFTPDFSVNEGVPGTIEIKRLNGTTGSASVELSILDQTATGGADYTPLYQLPARYITLNWPAGDATPRYVSIQTLTDAELEGTEYFSINLANATGAELDLDHDTVRIGINNVAGGGGDACGANARRLVSQNIAYESFDIPASSGHELAYKINTTGLSNGIDITIGHFSGQGVSRVLTLSTTACDFNLSNKVYGDTYYQLNQGTYPLRLGDNIEAGREYFINIRSTYNGRETCPVGIDCTYRMSSTRY